MTTRRTDVPALVAASVTVLSWASAFVVIRGVAGAIEPGPLALGRLLIGAAALGTVLLVRRAWVPPTGREWALLTLCGVAWFAVYNVALNAAEQRLDAGTTAMTVGLGPIVIALVAGLLLGEGFPRALWVGVAVAFGGTLLIGVATAGGAGGDLVGLGASLVAALTYAVGVLAQKAVLGRLPALQVTFVACATGAVVCLPFGPALVDDLGGATGGVLAGVVYLGLVPTALAFGTWAFALSRTSAGRLGVSTYLVPPLTVLLAWPMLGEHPPPVALAGGALCLVGVAITRRAP